MGRAIISDSVLTIFRRPCGVACSRLLPQRIWLPFLTLFVSLPSSLTAVLSPALAVDVCCTIWKVVVIYLSPVRRILDMTGRREYWEVRGRQRWGKRTRTRPRSRIVYVVYCWLHYLVASLLRCWAAALVSARLPLSVCLPAFSYLSWADVSWLPALPSPPRSPPFALDLPHTCRAM